MDKKNYKKEIRGVSKINILIKLVALIVLVFTPLSFQISNNTLNFNASTVFADEYQDQLQKLKDANEKARQVANELGTYLKNHKPTLGNFSSFEYRKIEARAEDVLVEINTINGNLRLMALTEDQKAEVARVVEEGKKLIVEALSNPVDVSAQKKSEVKTKYTLLAPIAKLTCIDMSGKDPKCVSGLGEYLNTLVKIIIGLCGVTAVVMLVINFIGYMSSESFTEKAKFKEKFWGPIGGLILALGAYAILTTINPSLTGTDGLTIESVGIELEPEDYSVLTQQQAISVIQSYKSGTGEYADPNPGPTSLPDTTEGIVNLPGIIKNEVAPVIERSDSNNVKGILIHGTAGGGTPSNGIAGWIDNNIRYKRGERKRTITYKGKTVTVDVVPSSAHFIVGKDGAIVQAVRLNRGTNHCGKCTKPGTTYNTSVSIEVVMSCIKDCGTPRSEKKAVWEEPTRAQVASMTFLVNLLLVRYPTLDKEKDLYTHGEQASNRTYNEGRNTLDAIKPYLKNGK